MSTNMGLPPALSHQDQEIDATPHPADSYELAPEISEWAELADTLHPDRQEDLQGAMAGIEDQPSDSAQTAPANQNTTLPSASAPSHPVPSRSSRRATEPHDFVQGSSSRPIQNQNPAPPSASAPSRRPISLLSPSAVAPHVSIQGSSQFSKQVDNALNRISSTPSGRQLLDELRGPGRKGNSVEIRETGGDHLWATPRLNQRQADTFVHERSASLGFWATYVAKKQGWMRSEGTGAVIEWNPSKSLRLDAEGRITGLDDNQNESHLALAALLIQARRITKGTWSGDPATELERAAGLGKNNQERISVASIRREEASAATQRG